jgi:tetratricopeptide (TPR) repeat protein
MAKSGKNTSKPAPKTPNVAAVQSAAPPTDHLARPLPTAPADGLLRKVFWGVAGLGLLLLLGLSFGSGINADDKFQVDYSEKLVNYYGTFGRDTSALFVKDGNMHLYGGFFEVVVGLANKALGLQPTDIGYHHLRHAASALMGWSAILCAGLLAALIAGWRAGLITLIIMLLSPRFVGDSLMNPKDIPFAAGYIMAAYNMAALLSGFPALRRWNLLGLIVGLGIAFGVRAGGLLSFAILFLFAGLHFLLKNGGLRALGNAAAWRRYALPVLGAALGGYALALLFWPFGLVSPLKNPFEALARFASLEVGVRVLYEGANRMSSTIPWTYPLKWIGYTVPLAVLLGFGGALLLLPRLLRRYQPLWVVLAFFLAIFPVFYVIYKDSVIHDGWRHLTFVYPPMAVVAALFWNELSGFFQEKKYLQWGVYALLGLGLADAGAFIAANPKMPYVYFNPLIGGVQGAFGKFETDYWAVSTRQGIEWLEAQGILRQGMTEPVVLATNMYYSTRQLTAKYGDMVKVKYLKWEKRCDDAWDYGLYPSRFIEGATLQKGKWPPDNAVHVVTAGGAPILAVLKDNGRNCALGMAALKLNDFASAIDRLKAEVANVPDNDLAWGNLAQAQLYGGQLDDAKASAEKTLEISPLDVQATNLIGLYWIEKGDAARARAHFEQAVKKSPTDNAAAWYYLALLDYNERKNEVALLNLSKAIQLAPNFRAAYELAAQIHESSGDPGKAAQIRAAMPK